ncbi:hypothetical protein ACIG3E_33560 [Streptomyces sp. NPDC053474]|uniref:MmyB family transcriptional regulator n=1 Tax=Streptomyces sp. NPDC053474 TaxID=3365704 RepID=UPI0037D42E61
MDTNRAGQILTRARQRTDANDYPRVAELRHTAGMVKRGRRVRHLSQAEVSLLLGYGAGQDIYARLERGLISNPPEDLLRAVGEILELQEHQWQDLNLAIYGRKASKPLDPHSSLAIHKNWSWVIRSQEHAAYISDFGWNVLECNQAADELFGPMPRNVMRWMLSLGGEEHSRAAMPDWAESWGPVALSQLTAALHEEPDHRELREIEREVLADPELGDLYRKTLDSYIHPDGTRRLMQHGTLRQLGVMDAAAATPMGSGQARVIFMKWTPLD